MQKVNKNTQSLSIIEKNKELIYYPNKHTMFLNGFYLFTHNTERIKFLKPLYNVLRKKTKLTIDICTVIYFSQNIQTELCEKIKEAKCTTIYLKGRQDQRLFLENIRAVQPKAAILFSEEESPFIEVSIPTLSLLDA